MEALAQGPARSQERLRPFGDIPQLRSGRLPVIGDGWAFNRDPVAFLRAARQEHGSLVRFRLGTRRALFVCDQELNRTVLQADDGLLDPGRAYPFLRPIFGPGIAYDASPERMSRQMAHVAPLLTGQHLAAAVPVMEEEIRQRVRAWGASGRVDLLPAVTEIVAAVTNRCLLGREFSRSVGPRWLRLYEQLSGGVRLAALLDARLPLPSFRRRDHARRRIAGELRQVMADRRAVAHPGTRGDALDTMLAAEDPLSDEEIVGILIAMTFVGQHNSAALAAWAGVVLLEQSPASAEVLAEQQALLGDRHASLSAGVLHRMRRLEEHIREAERLYPPSFVLLRHVAAPWQLSGYAVPEDTLVVLAPGVAHRLPGIWPHPDVCCPARHAAHEHPEPYSLIGFGGGTHRCIGLAFAYQVVKALWSVLLRRFDMALEGAPHRPDYTTAFVAPPSDPCILRYRLREAGTPT